MALPARAKGAREAAESRMVVVKCILIIDLDSWSKEKFWWDSTVRLLMKLELEMQ